MKLLDILETTQSEFNGLMQSARMRAANKKRILQDTPEGPTRVINQHGDKGFVGRDPSSQDVKFRFSYFSKSDKPAGHTTNPTFADALHTALDSGYSPIDDLYWEEKKLDEDDDLLELQMRYNAGANDDIIVVAFRGNYWLLGTHDDTRNTPEQVIMDIYNALGVEADEENLDPDELVYTLHNLQDERPDIIYGTITNNELYVKVGTVNNPSVSSMIKKLVQELGLRGVNNNEMAFDYDDEEHYYDKSEITGKLPEVLYHGTSSDKVRQIAKFGLRPDQQSNWEDQGISHDDLIFGAPSYQGALFHANRTSGITGETEYLEPDAPFPVILAFKVPDQNLIEPDYDVASATMGYTDTADDLGYSNKDGYARHGNADEITQNNPEGRTWKSGNAFAYRGRIPANHIVGIYTNFMRGGLKAEADWSGVSFKDFYDEWDDMEKEYYGYDDEEDEDY